MSHFSVGVITKGKPCDGEIEEILRPFCECYEEGWNEEFFVYEQNEDNPEDGYYYNPNAKWDWFVIGGRWAGLIRTKSQDKQAVFGDVSWVWEDKDPYESKEPGIYKVDSCRIKDIITTNKEEYNKGLRFWELIIEGQEPLNEEEQNIKKFVFYSPEYYLRTYKTKENYAKARSEFSTYAVVKDGEWLEPGEMGWFGVSLATPEQEDKWNKEYYKLVFEDAEDDDYLTVVDCHI